MRKRMIAFAIVLMFCLGTAFASAENKIFYLGENPPDAVCAIGKRLYYLENYRTLLCYRLGDQEPAFAGSLESLFSPNTSENAYVSYLFTDGVCVYGINNSTGDVWQLIDDAGTFAPSYRIQLDLSPFSDDEGHVSLPFFSTAVADNTLSVCTNRFESDYANTLATWNLQTGQLLHVIDEGILFVAPYDDEHVLLLCEKSVPSEDDITSYTANLHHPSSGAQTLLRTLDSIGTVSAVLRRSPDSLCVLAAGTVYTYSPNTSDQPVISAYLPWDTYSPIAGLLNQSHIYLSSSQDGFAVRELDSPSASQGAMVIMNGPSTEQHNAFLRANPDASIILTDDANYSYGELTVGLQSGSVVFDLLGIDLTSIPFARLAQKGYLMEITDPTLLAAAVEMDPILIEACKVNGKLYAIPMDSYTSRFTYDADVLAEMKCSPDDLPANFPAFLTWANQWPEIFASWNESFTPFSGYFQDTMYQFMLDQYIALFDKDNQPLTFDTELFRTLLSAMKQTDFASLEDEMQFNSDDVWGKSRLLSDDNTLSLDSENRARTPYTLSLTSNEPPLYPINLKVMVVAARSKHQPLAVAYLRAIVQNYDALSEGTLFFPNHNEAVEAPYYADEMAYLSQRLAQLQTALPTAKDPAALQAQISEVLNNMAALTENRFAVSAESIAFYRNSIAPYLLVKQYRPEGDALEELLALYADNALDENALINQMQQRVWMAQQEDQ